MQLNDEQKNKLISKLTQLDGGTLNITCPICSNKEWDISDIVFELREFNGGNLVIGGSSRILPLLTITCRKCANTHFLNALKLGVIDQPKNPEIDGQK